MLHIDQRRRAKGCAVDLVQALARELSAEQTLAMQEAATLAWIDGWRSALASVKAKAKKAKAKAKATRATP